MSGTAMVGCTPVKTSTLNTDTNKALHDLTYKELQNMCMTFNLPANIKHSRMLTMLQARYAGDENTVHKILSEYREQRCRRRSTSKSVLPPEKRPDQTEHKSKRRRLLTANRYEDYCYIYPQAAAEQLLTSQLPSGSRIETGDMEERGDSSKQLKAGHTSAFETMKLVMEATAAQRDASAASEVTLHRTQPLLHSLLQERSGPSATETVCPPSALGMNASVPVNFYGKHTTWPMYVDVSRSGPCLPDTTTVPQVGILRSLLFDPGIDLSHLHDLNQASNCVPVEEAEDLTIGRRTTIQPPMLPPPCHIQTPKVLYPECVSSHVNGYSTCGNSCTPKCTEVVQHNYCQQMDVVAKCFEKELPAPLELVLNMKSDCLNTETPMPKFRKSAATSSYQCYIAPVCSTSVTGMPTEVSEENSGHLRQRTETELTVEPQWIPQEPHIFPQFHHNNQLSYPLIYSYLASTEEQLRQKNEEQFANLNLDWPPDAQHRPQAISSPNEMSQIMDSNNFLPTASEDCHLHVTHEQQHLQPSPGNCRYQINGCRKVGLEHNKLREHEKICTYQTVRCYNKCAWRSHLRHLATHLREVHKRDILHSDEASHTVPLHDVRALQKISFLQEVKRRVFVITVHCHGHLLYATVQSVPSWKPDKVSLVKASLEVVGQDGRPHSWRGKVRPVYESLSTLWATDQCLIMDPAAIGAFAGANIILHSKITVYVPGEKQLP